MNTSSKLEILANVGAFIAKYRVCILWEPKGVTVSCVDETRTYTSTSEARNNTDALIVSCRDLWKQLEWYKDELKPSKSQVTENPNSGVS